MKKAISLITVLVFLILAFVVAQESQPKKPEMPVGMKGSYETIQSKVIKVYSAEDNGAQFRAYAVKWKDNEVIASDVLGKTSKKVGDSITFMAQRIEMPRGEKKVKLLQFMIMEIPSSTKKTESNKSIE